MLKRGLKRLLSSIMAAVLLLTMLPASALAAVSETIGNDAAENAEILAQLEALTGSREDAEAMYARLNALGVLSEDGWVTENLVIDGVEYTLDEAKAIVDALPDDTIVAVGETAVTADALKTMLAIEKQIEAIRDEWYNGEDWSPEQRESIASLQRALAEDDFVVTSEADAAVIGGSGISHSARVSVDQSGLSFRNNAGAQTVRFQLSGAAAGQEVSFQIRAVDGSAKSDVNYQLDAQTVTMTAGADGTASAEVAITIQNDTGNSDSSYAVHTDGSKIFYLLYDSIENALFANEKTAGASVVSITGFAEPVLKQNYTEQTIAINANNWQQEGMLYTQTIAVNDANLRNAANSNLYNVETTNVNTNGWMAQFKEWYGSYGNFTDNIYLNWNGSGIYSGGYTGSGVGRFFSENTASPNRLDASNKVTIGYYYSENSYEGEILDSPPEGLNTTSATLVVRNEAQPSATAVSIPEGTFYSGQYVPVTVSFSEPVKADGAVLMVNGRALQAAEPAGTVCNILTFPYLVQDVNENLELLPMLVTEITGVQDAADAGMVSSVPPAATGMATMQSGLMENALESISIDPQTVLPNTEQLTVTAMIADGYEQVFAGNQEEYRVFASIDGGANKTELTLSEEGETAYFTGQLAIGANLGDQSRACTVELYVGADAASAELYFGRAVSFTQEAAQYLDETEFSIKATNFPSENETIYADQEDVLSVQAVLADGATGTWNDVKNPEHFTWGIEVWQEGTDGSEGQWVADTDKTVADVVVADDPSNPTIALLGSGKFRVTLTANNGDKPDTPADQRHAATVHSSAVTLGLGNNPILRIAPNLQSISIQSGQDAILRWTSNLTEKQAELGNPSQEFKIEVFQALNSNYQMPDDGSAPNFDNTSIWEALDPITVTSTPADTISTYALEGLTQVSVTGGYSYGIRLTALFDGTTYPAYAYVAVSSQPAVVELAEPELYWTESTGANGVDLHWTIRNFDTTNEENTAFEITVTNNDTGAVVAEGDKDTLSGSGDSQTGSLHFTFDGLQSGNWRETYTVELRARNHPDSTWSYDSAVLYYYDNDAFQIYVNGEPAGDSLTMSNEDNLVDGTEKTVATMTRNEILALGRDIALADEIGINPLVPWGNVTDQVTWTVDGDAASLNYRQGTLYENINRFSYTSYNPKTVFMLSGLQDGETTLSAAHKTAADVLHDALSVQVETLKDKLYLFRLYPAADEDNITVLEYVNGSGETKTVYANANGEAAVYEPSGIASDVSCRSKIGGTPYVGTIPQENLVSGEMDSTKLELYPLNTLKLREVSSVQLYLKDENGNPYANKELTIHAGVYKNGVYCENARFTLDPNDNATIPGSGEGFTARTDDSGRLSIYMDATQFYTADEAPGTELEATDQLQFMFEVEMTGDGTKYYPQLLERNAMMSASENVRFGESIINLRLNEGTGERPFIAAQSVDLGAGGEHDLSGFTGKIGPGAVNEQATLKTTVFWWGQEDAGDNQIAVKNSVGASAPDQTSVTRKYEFTDTYFTESAVEMNAANIGSWVPAEQSTGLIVEYQDGDGSVLRTDTPPFQVVDMTPVPDPVSDPSSNQNLQQLIQELLAQLGQQVGNALWDINDGVIGAGVDMLQGENFALGDALKLSLYGTEDPTVFRGLFRFSVGEDITMQEDETGFQNSLDSVGDTAQDLMSLTEMKSEIRKAKRGKAVKGLQPSAYMAGYIESEVCYKDGHWRIHLLNGGIGASAGMEYSWKINTSVSIVPVTAEFIAGAGVGIELGVGADRVDDLNYYLTELRIAAYFRAFAGVGFDYTVIALKIGLFGEIDFAVQARWFNEHGDNPKYGNMNAQNLNVGGQVGIEFYAKFLFWAYRNILASAEFTIADKQYGSWDDIEAAWDNVSQGRSEYNTGTQSRMYYNSRTGQTLYASPTVVEVENRDYLEKYDRAWNPNAFGLQAIARALDLGADSGIDETWTNAYPYAEPALTEDGQIMVYLDDMDSTDVEQTRAAYSVWDGTKFKEGTPIDESKNTGHGDSQLAVSGTGEFAASAWVRMTDSLGAETGEPISEYEQAAAMNSTDIMVSVYKNGSWDTEPLTSNSTPDLAPVVVANGDKAIVAWRAVSASDMAHLTRFDTGDSILYSTYENSEWSEPKTLYNGTSGAVKGLEAAMLDDGTAAVVYTIDTNDKPLAGETVGRSTLAGQASGDNTGLEVVYAVVNDLKDGAQTQDDTQDGVTNVRLTYDNQLDENPQITTSRIGEDEHFIIGWSRTEVEEDNSTTDLALRAVKADGTLRSDMPDSVAEMTGDDGVRITSNFRFAQNSETIDNLSIVWVEPVVETEEEAAEDTAGADKDRLMAVKISANTDSGGNTTYGLTVPVEMALMDDYTTIDSFDVYVNEDKNLRAVILGASYDQGYEAAEDSSGNTLQVQNEDGTTSDVLIAASKSTLYTATGSYANAVGIDEVAYEPSEIIPGYVLPLQVTVTNRGIDPITALDISIGGDKVAAADDISLAPGEKLTLTAEYWVPENVQDADCTVTAAFGENVDATATEQLELSAPDVGISRLDLITQEDGKRVLQAALFSGTEVPLDSSKHVVKLGLYSDAACTNSLLEQDITISDSDLTLVNEGGYSTQLTFDIADYVKNTLKQSEIPDGGVQVYAKAWIERKPDESILSRVISLFADNQENTDTAETVDDTRTSNNIMTTSLTSLLEQHNGEAATVTSVLDNSGSGTQVTVTVQNNSISGKTSGNLIVSLLDENGNVIEQQQSYQVGAENSGLIELGPEQRAERTFTFTQKGASVQVTYSDAVLQDNGNTKLSSVTLERVALTYDPETHTYTGTHQTTGGALLTVVPEDPRAQVTISGGTYQANTGKLTLNGGTVTAQITVTAQDGTQQIYTISVTGDGSSQGGSGGSSRPFDVTVSDDIRNGTVGVSPERAERGDTVTITASPDSGYVLGDLTVTDADGNPIRVTDAGGGRYTFTMPGSAVKIEASFMEAGTAPALPFTDVSLTDWYREAVQYVYDNGMMNGIEATLFGPDMPTNRAMIVTILHRLEGQPQAGASRFEDVASGAYYADAVAWAEENDIVNGVSATAFAPEDPITREQMAAILYRYAQFKGYDVTAGSNLSRYTDAPQISEYAVPAMQWANAEALITGVTGTTLEPQGSATRAQVATILTRFCEDAAQ